MILKIVFGCVLNLPVGCIKIRHTDLLLLQDCGRLWRGYRLGVYNCSHQLIALIDLKLLQVLCKIFIFVDCWILFIVFNGSAFIGTATCIGVCLQIVCWTYSNRTYRFSSPCGFVYRSGEGDGCVIVLGIINWLTGLNSTIIISSFWFLFKLVSSEKEEGGPLYIFIYKHHCRLFILWESYIVLVCTLQLFKEGPSRFGG